MKRHINNRQKHLHHFFLLLKGILITVGVFLVLCICYREICAFSSTMTRKSNSMTERADAFGVTGQTIPLTEESVIQTLKQQIPIICSMRPGDFTDSGHFIVLTGYIDGKIKVNDPYSYANSERLWDFEVLKPQIKNLWQMLVMEKTNETEIPG